MTLKIAIVHQAADLYGSGRVLLDVVHAIRGEHPDARVTVILPCHGPLEACLPSDIEVRIEALAIARRTRSSRLPALAFALPGALVRAARTFRSHDLVYINTAVIVDYWLAARFFRGKAIGHVHELPTGVARTLMAWLVRQARIPTVFVSKASRAAFARRREARYGCVWNACADGVDIAFREPGAPYRVLLPGRLNDWKGQDLLIEALAVSPKLREKVHVRIVGDSFGETDHAQSLERLIQSHDFSETVELVGFNGDMPAEYRWADIVVVPSRKPEPFGLVAIEGLANGRAVVAADHGGLTEIASVAEASMRLFPPNDPAALARAILASIGSPETLKRAQEAAVGAHAASFAPGRFRRELNAFIEAAWRAPQRSGPA